MLSVKRNLWLWTLRPPAVAVAVSRYTGQLLAGALPTVTARDGKISVEMCLAAYQSAHEGRRVLLEGE